MAANGLAPSASPTYENHSSTPNPGSFTAHPKDSSVIGGESSGGGGYKMLILPQKSTTNCKQVPVPPTQSPPPPISGNPTLPEGDLTTPPPSKRPRGRPPGSKNKAKQSTITNEDSENILKSIVIEVPPGNDVIESLINFAHDRQLNLTVLSASGTVSEIDISHPLTNNGPAFPYRGLYQIVSLSGTYSNAPTRRKNFMIYFSRTQAGTFGGIVAGKVMAASQVDVLCAMFKNPEHHKVPRIGGSVPVEQGGGNARAIINHHSSETVGMVARNNNVGNPFMSSYAPAAGESSTPLNRQIPPYPPTNVMQWNQYINPRGY